MKRVHGGEMDAIGEFIGLSIRADRVCGNLATLARDLYVAEELGFGAVEIPAHGLDILLGGRLIRSRLQQLKDVLDKFSFRITMHAPDILNLQDTPRQRMQSDLFAACVDLCFALGAEILVYHQGCGNGSEADLQQEIEELARMGEIAAAAGLRIGVENGDRPIFNLVELIQAVGSKNVGITYDFGHDHLTSGLCRYDLISGLHAAAPYIVHLHLHDNLGRTLPETTIPLATEEPLRACPLGEGDLHLPPGWGSIPYHRMFNILRGYKGICILELHKRFFEPGYAATDDHPVLAAALQTAKEHLAVAAPRVPLATGAAK